jgi:hypothetical protein
MRPLNNLEAGTQRQEKNSVVPVRTFTIPSMKITIAVAGEYNIFVVLAVKSVY